MAEEEKVVPEDVAAEDAGGEGEKVEETKESGEGENVEETKGAEEAESKVEVDATVDEGKKEADDAEDDAGTAKRGHDEIVEGDGGNEEGDRDAKKSKSEAEEAGEDAETSKRSLEGEGEEEREAKKSRADEGKEEPAKATLEAGAIVKAKYGNSFFEATVLEVGESTIKLKWKFDDSEAEVSKDDLQAEEAKEEPLKAALEAGAIVKAKFGNSFFEATVLEVGESTIKLKWKFDDSEAEVSKDDLQAEEAKPQAKIEVGKIVKAKYGNSFFEASVLEVGDSTVKLKWKFDDSEADVPIGDVQADEATEESAEPVIEEEPVEPIGPVDEGMFVEGKFGNSWFEAVVIADGKATVAVKWKHDDSIAGLKRDELRFKTVRWPDGKKVEVDNLVKGKFCDLFFEATVLEVGESTVKLKWKFDDSEAEFSVADLHKRFERVETSEEKDEEGEKIGLTIETLVNEGEFKGKIIGKQASKKKAIAHICGGDFEIEKESVVACIVGTAAQRARIKFLIGILQVKGDTLVDIAAMPEALASISSQMRFPKRAENAVVGEKKANLIQVETDCQIMMFFSAPPKATAAEKSEKLDVSEGVKVEAQQKGGDWLDAEVLKVFRDDDDDPDDADTMVRVKFTSDSTEALLPYARVRAKLEGDADAERRKADDSHKASDGMLSFLAIGQEQDVKLAEAKLKVRVEAALPGTYEKDGDSTVKTLEMTADEAWKCQEAVARRQNIARATQCSAVEVVGEKVYVLGGATQCDFAIKLVKTLLLDVMEGAHTDTLDDACNVKALVRKDKRKNLTGDVLAELEKETHTFVFFDDGAAAAGLEDEVRAVICGHSKESMDAAAEKLDQQQHVEAEAPAWEEKKWEDEKKWDEKAEDAGGKIEVGATVQGKYGNGWFDAEVLEVSESTIKVKWGFDSSEADLATGDVKLKDGADSGKKDEAKSWDSKDDKKWEEKKEQSWDKKEDSWDKKDQSWDKKEQSWDKKEQSWDKKEEPWDKKEQSWDKKEQSWDKKEDSWDKKDQSWDKKEQSWDKKEQSWDKKEQSWDKKEQSWDKKDQSWDKKEESWDKKDQSWDKKDQSWDKKEQSWDKKDQSWEKKDQSWDKKDQSWDKKDDQWNKDSKGGASWGNAASSKEANDRPWNNDQGGQGQKRSWNESSPASNSRPRQAVPSKPPLEAPKQTRPAVAPRPTPRPSGIRAGLSKSAVPHEDEGMEVAAQETTDPEAVLETMAFPKSIQEWHLVQDVVFAGHDPLPDGWIRAWSRSRKCVYYVRMSDNKSVFKVESIV